MRSIISDLLRKLDIFYLGELGDGSKEVMLYAPLSNNCAVVSYEDVKYIERQIRGEINNSEIKEFLDSMKSDKPVFRINKISDFRNLSILPTNKCNFSCQYCYSAKGRSSQTIDYSAVESIIRWFIGMDRETSHPLHVTFFGGGEPILCWDTVVRPAIDLVIELRRRYSAPITITLITNGSILPEDFIDVCRSAKIDLAVSFEILQELQDAQRCSYHAVCNNIRSLCDKGVVPAINSVITDAAVKKMPEMVIEIKSKFPEIKYLAFEPETSSHSAEFFQEFTDMFFEALAIASRHGMHLTTSALRNCDVTVERYCAGELALTANGDLSICPCLASPLQPGYKRWIYGNVTSRGVKIDTNKLTELLKYDVNTQQWCDDCFARFNCGGGCINHTIDLHNTPDEAYCRFFKNFLKKVIKSRING